MLQGFVEAFQPDLIIETKVGQTAGYGIDFPEKRIGLIDDLLERDQQGRRKIGVDLRSVCDDMYDKTRLCCMNSLGAAWLSHHSMKRRP